MKLLYSKNVGTKIFAEWWRPMNAKASISSCLNMLRQLNKKIKLFFIISFPIFAER
jgi:hypothetical protein